MNETFHISSILVPIDGSEYSRHAARHAVRIAKAFGSKVTFLHVVSNHLVAELAPHDRDDGQLRVHARLAEQGSAYLRDAVRLAEESEVQSRQIISDGDPCAVICETASSLGADLIVMGKIGRHGARRILMGSIARGVIESSDRPVLIVSSASK